MSGRTTTFTNCRLCIAGKLVQRDLVVSNDTGRILYDTPSTDSETINLGGAIIAPGLIELQTNGMRGFHFTHFEDEQSYAKKVDEVARYLPSTGCTGFYATIPTVSAEDFKKVLQHCLHTAHT
jgi:N-acetylglucosamine-6-phosphate deacetylase